MSIWHRLCMNDAKYYRARVLFAANFTVKEVAKSLGISELRAKIYKKAMDMDRANK